MCSNANLVDPVFKIKKNTYLDSLIRTVFFLQPGQEREEAERGNEMEGTVD